VTAWADALQSLLTDATGAATLAAAGRDDAWQRYGLQRMTADYEALLHAVCPSPPP
jgi:hypothetical protein